MLPSISFQCPIPKVTIQHQEKICLIGSCFTEHIGNRFQQAKFEVVENPHGILFNPLSIVRSLQTYLQDIPVVAEDLFYQNEIWNHWDFHTRFSSMQVEETLAGMNASIHKAAKFIKEADWLVITLGSAFQYFLKENDCSVANCHRAPGQMFDKRMLATDLIYNELQQVIAQLQIQNPQLKIIFTISPVRHIREGVIENNRSKARLIEAVHQLVESVPNVFYFPAYELLIDVLRDYRFYDIDMVHPNFAATNIVWEHFFKTFFDEPTQELVRSMEEISTAFHHKIRFPETQANAKFKAKFLASIHQFQQTNPYINFEQELAYFGA